MPENGVNVNVNIVSVTKKASFLNFFFYRNNNILCFWTTDIVIVAVRNKGLSQGLGMDLRTRRTLKSYLQLWL